MIRPHLHSGRGDDRADVGHDGLGEDLVDEAVVPAEPRVRHVLHAQAVVRIVLLEEEDAGYFHNKTSAD